MFSPMHDTKPQTDPMHGSKLRKPSLSYTLAEAAEELRVTERFIYNLIERGDLISYMPGRKRLVSVESVKAYLKRLAKEEKALRERATKQASRAIAA